MLTKEKALQILKEAAIIIQENNIPLCVLAEPELRYLTEEQAREWLKIGSFSNAHTFGGELAVIQTNHQRLLSQLHSKLVLVDLGCGDGIKSAQLVNLLNLYDVNIADYFAVDINQVFIDTTLERLETSTSLRKTRLHGMLANFEQLISRNDLPWRVTKHKNADRLYLLLGNTFNNFEPRAIKQTLRSLLAPDEKLLIGVKLRSSDEPAEIERIVNQYRSYGNDFTFSLGRIFGLDDTEMHRVVEFNVQDSCINIILETQRPVGDLAKDTPLRRFLVCKSYKPTLRQLNENLHSSFELSCFTSVGIDDAVILAR